MKRLSLFFACLILLAATSSAQTPGGTIRVYADELGSDCNIIDETPGMVSFYLFHENSPGASAVELQLDLAGFAYSSYFGDSSPYGLKIGNFPDGASISYGTCLFGTIYLGAARFMGTGATRECHYVFVKNHPVPSVPGASTPIAVDCWGGGQLMHVNGSAAIINPTEDCQCPDIFENCPAAGSGTLLFAAQLSTDAGHISDPPGVPYTYATTLVSITRLPNEIIYLSGSPDAWTPLVADDDITINSTSVGPGPYTVLDPSYPLDTPVDLILQPELADAIPVSLIPYGTSCVVIGLADTQREIYGNTDIYLFITESDPTTLTIACPDTITVPCVEQIPPADVSGVTVSSDCPGDITVIHVGDVSDGQSCPEIITRTYQATDNCYNQERCSQTIVVIDPGTPVIAGGPADLSVQCAEDIPPPNVALITTAGGCAAGITVTHESDTPLTGPCGGFVDRTYRATNACGNYGEYVQRITVADTTPPVFSNCPPDAVIQCVEDVPPADPAITDNCGGTITPVVDVIQETPDRLRRTWTATDQCGNVATCEQILTIHDTTAPSLHGCPSSMFLTCGSEVPPPANVTATDNCDRPLASFTFAETETNPGSDCDNVISRTWTAVDSSGNTKSYTQHISLVVPAVCQVIPQVLDFHNVSEGYSKDLSFMICNVGTSVLAGSVIRLPLGEACEAFSIQSGGGEYSLGPGELLTVVVRFSPPEGGDYSCTIYTGTDCDVVTVLGTGYIAVDVAVRSHAISWRDDHVELNWRVRDVAGALSFEVARKSHDGDLVPMSSPEITQNGEEYIFFDRTAEPGATYGYRVTVMEDGIAATSFETAITIPAIAFALDPAHPNPFKDAATIGFSVQNAEKVSLEVFDITGTHICTLVDRSMTPGTYFATWDGRDKHGRRAASGIYFYRLRAGKQALIRKMVLLR